jgi:hypothetical protein
MEYFLETYFSPEWSLVWATLALAIFTAALFLITVRMAREAAKTNRRQADEIKQSLEISGRNAQATEEIVRRLEAQSLLLRAQLRARVALSSISIGNIANPIAPPGVDILQSLAALNNPGFGPIVHMSIQNYGHTVAINVRHAAEIVISTYPYNNGGPLPVIHIEDEQFASTMVLAPGTISTKWRRLSRPLTQDEIIGLRNNTMALYAYGLITYRDDLMQPDEPDRLTRYFMFHNENTGGIGLSTDMTVYSDGNDVT